MKLEPGTALRTVMIAGLSLSVGCAGPTTPLGAVWDISVSGVRRASRALIARAAASPAPANGATDSAARIRFEPGHQVLRGAHTLAIRIAGGADLRQPSHELLRSFWRRPRMKNRPKELTWLAALLVCVAVALPLQIAFLYDHGLEEPGRIAAKLAPLNWAILLLCPLTAWLTLRGSRWLLAIAPLLGGVIAWNNWLVAEISEDYSPWAAGMSTALFFIALGSLLTRQVREMLARPELRWWLTPPRLRATVPIRIHIHTRNLARRGGFGSTEFYTKTLDISEGGAFIPFEPSPTASTSLASPAERNAHGLEVLGLPREAVAVGTQCFVSLPLRGLERLQCRAEIVRTVRDGTPAAGAIGLGGIGIRFVGLSIAESRKLKSLLSGIPQTTMTPAAPKTSAA